MTDLITRLSKLDAQASAAQWTVMEANGTAMKTIALLRAKEASNAQTI
ncbi:MULTISPECIES: hypothetical protein [Brucella/Ochrobactrum group]|nr:MULTISPECIES: hypothetical protein [Brucella/Ochrobactrum group]MCQ9145133.1 hypothetical protein [Ochrobactrum sp. BTU2]UGQ23258.1 hypothetical protein LRL11_22460 [Brucella anthropi]